MVSAGISQKLNMFFFTMPCRNRRQTKSTNKKKANNNQERFVILIITLERSIHDTLDIFRLPTAELV